MKAITANRLIAHGPSMASVAEALTSQADVWPTHHPVFVSLGRLVPTPELMNWTIPDNAAIEIPAQTLVHPQTQALMAQLRDAGVGMCLTWFQPGTALPAGHDWRFVLIDARRNPAPTSARLHASSGTRSATVPTATRSSSTVRSGRSRPAKAPASRRWPRSASST